MSNLKKSRIARIASGVVGLMTSVMMMGGVAVLPAAAADSAADLQAKINALLAQINALQGTSAPAAMSSYTFATTLKLGSKGADVMALQKALNADGEMVAASGAGSPGKESSTFGPATKAAVIKFQEKYASECLAPVGLTKGTGVVGALTRAKLNSLAAAAPAAVVPSVTPGATPAAPGATASAGTLTVSGPASMQPAAALAPYSASRIPFTKITLTAGASDVTVDNIVVERVGASTDAALAGVDLLDDSGQMIGLEKTINSDHKSYVGNPFVIKAGTSKTLTIAGTRAGQGSHGGEAIGLRVVGITTEGSVTLAGDSLPILGATHTVNETLGIGSVTSFVAGPLNPSAQSKPIGSNGYIFTSIKFTAGSNEKVWLKSIRWNQAGSAAAGDIANVKTYVDGTAYDTTVSSDGKYYTSIFGNGILIDKGGSKEIYVQGDVVGGSGRTISFDVYRNTDLVVTGDTYGYSLVPPTTGTSGVFGSTNPWYNANDVTVQSGTLNVSKSSTVAAQNIAINLANQPLGGFEVEVKGEPITVTAMNFQLNSYKGTGAGASTQDITDVKLVDSTGKVIAGPVDINADSNANPDRVPFTDSVTFPIGKGTYTLVGKLGTDWATNQTIAASTTASGWTATGQTTGNSITPTPSSAVTGNTMTVKAAVVTITNSASPAAQTVVAGAQNFTFANIQLDASASGEDIKFSSLKASFVNGGNATYITGCALYDGSSKLTSGSNEINPTASGDSSFIFDSGSFIIPKGTVKTLALHCNIAGSATTSSFYTWGIPASASQSTATGMTSGQSATITESAATGQQMTISSAGTLTVTTDSSSPSYAVAAAGTTGNVLGVLKFHAANEAIDLQKLSLQLTNGSASSSPNDLVQVTLWDASGNNVGSAIFSGSNRNATSTLTAGSFIVPKDGDKIMTIKGDFQPIGVSQIGRSGALVAVDYDGADVGGTQGKGVASGSSVNASPAADSAVSGVRLFKSYPTITMLSLPTNTLDTGSKSLMRFKVTANSTGDIGVYKFTVKIATTTATLSSINAYAYTDSSFQTGVSGVGSGGLLTNSALTWVSSTGQIDVYANLANSSTKTIVQIPAGSSRYYEIKASCDSGCGTSGASVSTQLEGDANYFTTANTLVDNVAGVDVAAGDNDFIWTDNATGTAVVADQDWSNGFNLAGLKNTNNDAQTLSK